MYFSLRVISVQSPSPSSGFVLPVSRGKGASLPTAPISPASFPDLGVCMCTHAMFVDVNEECPSRRGKNQMTDDNLRCESLSSILSQTRSLIHQYGCQASWPWNYLYLNHTAILRAGFPTSRSFGVIGTHYCAQLSRSSRKLVWQVFLH